MTLDAGQHDLPFPRLHRLELRRERCQRAGLGQQIQVFVWPVKLIAQQRVFGETAHDERGRREGR